MTSVTQPYMTADEERLARLAALNSDTIYLAILDALSDRTTRNAVEDALAEGDAVEATRILLNAINRISTTPAHPVPARRPQPQDGTRAEVSIEKLAMLAGQTP